jgi:hypothetical protein
MSIVNRHITPPTTRQEADFLDLERRSYWPDFTPIQTRPAPMATLSRAEVTTAVQIVALRALFDELTLSRLAGARSLELSVEAPSSEDRARSPVGSKRKYDGPGPSNLVAPRKRFRESPEPELMTYSDGSCSSEDASGE